MPSEYNPNLIASMEAKFRRLNNPAHAMADAVGMLQMFPGLVGLWPCAGAGGGAANPSMLTDVSGNGLHLTLNTAASHTTSGLIPVVNFVGTGSYYHADAAIFDILGTESHIQNDIKGLTIGGWFQFDRLATAETLLSKWTSGTGANSYLLQKHSNDTVRLFVEDSSSNQNIAASASAVNTSGWFFCAGRFDPSTEVAVWLNGEKTVNTTSIIAAIDNTATRFEMAARDTGAAGLLDGRVSLAFLCAAAVPDIFIDTYFQMTAPLFGVSV